MTLKMVNGDAEFAKGFINPYAYLREYCLQDSVVVSEALKKFSLELRKLGYSIQVQESITASSIGMKV